MEVGVATKTATLSSVALAKQNWEKVTSDPWVLQTVQGYSQELITAPTQSFLPGQVIFTRMARGTCEGGDKSLLEKGAKRG